jgi:pre-mRNA cleavage complex 2 protein Pcf11
MQEWLKSREVIDVDHVPTTEDVAAQAVKASEAAKPKYIPVPDPSRGINLVCPICQDRFENKWLDTVLVGNRAYHASCHAEATRDRENTPVLGKRKAETSIASPKVRSLKTSA